MIKNLLKNVHNSLINNNEGYSGRKLTALAFTVLVYYLHYYYINTTNVIQAIIIDISTILVCLSIVTVENIISFFSKKE